MKWLILAVFLFGIVALLNWHEAGTKEPRMAFEMMAIAALVVVLGWETRCSDSRLI